MFVSKPAFPQEAGVCSEGVSLLPSQELQPPGTGRRAAAPLCLPHRAPTAGTQALGAASDENAHELRAALWDRA